MSDSAGDLSLLLDNLLTLQPIEEKESSQSIFNKILTQYELNEKETDATFAEYTHLELIKAFEISNVDDNFKLDDTESWLNLFTLPAQSTDILNYLTIAYHVIISLASLSIINRQKLARIKGLKHHLCKTLFAESDQSPNVALSAALSELYSIILSVDGTPKDISDMYRELPNHNAFHIVQEFLGILSNPSSQTHLQFENYYRIINIPQRGCGRTPLTLQFVVEFNNVTSNRFAVLGLNTFLEIKESKLCVSNDEFTIALFEYITFEPNKAYVISLTINKNDWTLFVDGSSGHTITLFDGFTLNIVAIEIGSMICSFKLYKFLIWSKILSEEAISLFHEIGYDYQPSYESNDYFWASKDVFGPNFLQVTYLLQKHFDTPFKEYVKKVAPLKRANLLLMYDIEDEILNFRTKDSFFVLNWDKESGSKTARLILGKCYYFQSKNIKSILLSIGCFNEIMFKLQHSSSIEETFAFIKHLFSLLQYPTLKLCFEREFGYENLAYILKKNCVMRFAKGLSIEFMNLFLAYTGWDFENIEKSLIREPSAYQSLILDFALWHNPTMPNGQDSGDEREILQFLSFHSTCLLTHSLYKEYNTRELKKSKALQKFCFYLHHCSLVHCESRKNDLVFLLNTFLVDNYKEDEWKWFVHSGFFLLAEGNFRIAEIYIMTVKKSLDDVIKRENWNELTSMLKYLSPKVLLGFMNSSTDDKVCFLLNIKLLLQIIPISQDIYRSFLSTGGMKVIFGFLTKLRFEFCLDVLDLLMDFGFTEFSKKINKHDMHGTNLSNDTELSNHLADFLYLCIYLLEWVVLNDIGNVFSERIQGDLTKLLCSIEDLHNRFFILDPNSTKVLSLISDLLITLMNPELTSPYGQESTLYMKLICEQFECGIRKLSPVTFNAYISKFLFNGIIDDCIFNYKQDIESQPYLDLFFFGRLLPKIFGNISNEGTGMKNDVLGNNNAIPNIIVLFERLKRYICAVQPDPDFTRLAYKILFECADLYSTRAKTTDEHFSAFSSTISYYLQLITYNMVNKHLNWNEDHLNEFYSDVLSHHSILFDRTSRLNTKKISTCLLYALVVQLSNNGYNEDLIICIKQILTHNQDNLDDVIPFLGTHKKRQLLNEFTQLTSTNTEEHQEAVLAILIDHVLDDGNAQLYSLQKDVLINPRYHPINMETFKAKILERKRKVIHYNYSEVNALVSSFRRNTAVIFDKVIQASSKMYKNMAIDLEENVKFQSNKVYGHNTRFEHITKVQYNETDLTVWMLGSEENSNRMKTKLLPYFNPKHIATDADTNNIDVADMDTETANNQQRNRTTSNLSYDLLSDVASVSLGEKSKNENRKVLKLLSDDDTINSVWNASLIVGLEIFEGILILGKKNLYYVSDYYYCSGNEEVLNLRDIPWSQRDMNINIISGTLNESPKPTVGNILYTWSLEKLVYSTKKPFLFRDVAIELLFENKSSVFMSFLNKKVRNEIYLQLKSFSKPELLDPISVSVLKELDLHSNYIGSTNGITKANLSTRVAKALASGSSLSREFEVTKLWKTGQISNFYYLIIVNILAGRSFNDITQYPVFPWVLSDYTSEELDLTKPETYRDLSKPMGAQSKDRLNKFIERYEALDSLNDPEVPPFNYGTHYSSAMIVSSYLVRLKPFTESFLILQDGQFGHVDRLFNSIERAWISASVENTTDVRELIPEFYFLPEFLINVNNIDFGKDQKGKAVNDVILPPWAKNDPKTFVKKNREALESQYVTEHLNEWIDLIFGYKQRGEEAVKSTNIFNHLSYPGAVNLDNIHEEVERRAVTGIIHNFGQTPLQIFEERHPSRKFSGTNLHLCEDYTVERINSAITSNSGMELSIAIQTKDTVFFVKVVGQSSLTINEAYFIGIHETVIDNIVPWKGQSFITTGNEGLIKVWSFKSSYNRIELSMVHAVHGALYTIKQIGTYADCNLVVTLDASGAVYTWDMSSFLPIRCVTSDCLQLTVSNLNGNISVISKQNKLIMFNLNGLIYTETILKRSSRVTHLNSLELDFTHNIHEYAKDLDWVSVAFADGTVELYSLMFDTPSSASPWEVKLMVSQAVPIKPGEFITSVKLLVITEGTYPSSSCSSQFRMVKCTNMQCIPPQRPYCGDHPVQCHCLRIEYHSPRTFSYLPF
ncbi:Bph1p KNAG_0C00880 [Huiozyma naganishii CBS 8797]|uniref:Beige protein homolog 1 n=1 Tax=Huiozyma naganishii (strain ATCC MYA-139 / BCRC 22969 / CBS 8797 / KCTC 17520 / NBRC 10181 / NCYC 3082 / Yp74L-3) TaxID=1071383 RepID=J7S5K2_HUIN7|nr:hypothetical protein KNAG_0C00880 [Kazachstania naganishii CBS 8797]CCK69201.1 hypothetical protein KNAG_0C00880 [Kazachstania naganishii CBS 8797]